MDFSRQLFLQKDSLTDFWQGPKYVSGLVETKLRQLKTYVICISSFFISFFRLQTCQISKKELFSNIVWGWKPLTIFEKSFILDVWHGSEYASEHILLLKVDMQNKRERCAKNIKVTILEICVLKIYTLILIQLLLLQVS